MTWNDIVKRFQLQDKRNSMLRNNIVWSAILKAIGLLCSLLIVPITLDYLNNEVYGIWFTMSSILYWFAFFDIGLGNGMRNYLTQAISEGDYEKGCKYISTTFTVLTGIAVTIGAVAFVCLSCLDMNKVFNTHMIDGGELYRIMILAVFFTLALFVVKNIGFIFVALQRYAVNDLLVVSGNAIALFIIYAITKSTVGNLMYVVMAFTITPVIIFLLAAIPVFRKYPQLRPSLRKYDKNIAIQITSKGLGFFLIQITSCLVIYGSSNIIIAQICGPESVTVYNIAFKYFNLLAIAYTIIISPMWSAYTDAYVKGDMKWIQSTFNRALKLWGLTSVGGVFMLVVANHFYLFWVGNDIIVPFSLSASVAAYICFFNLNNCVTYLINGLNKIRIQIYTSIIVTIAYLLTVVLLRSRLGMEGVIMLMGIGYALMSLIHLHQCRLLIRGTAHGIWNR